MRHAPGSRRNRLTDITRHVQCASITRHSAPYRATVHQRIVYSTLLIMPKSLRQRVVHYCVCVIVTFDNDDANGKVDKRYVSSSTALDGGTAVRLFLVIRGAGNVNRSDDYCVNAPCCGDIAARKYAIDNPRASRQTVTKHLT